MRHATRIARFAAIGVFGALVLTGCDDDDPMSPGDVEVPDSPLQGQTVTQVDRFGLPAINTAFVSGDANKNAFNRAAPANDGQFVPVASDVIQQRYAVPADLATALADAVLPDVQPLGNLEGYAATGTPFNGRRLSDDVIDAELAILFGECPALPFPCPLSEAGGGDPVPALASDNVDGNDREFLDEFPFLAPPHQDS